MKNEQYTNWRYYDLKERYQDAKFGIEELKRELIDVNSKGFSASSVHVYRSAIKKLYIERNGYEKHVWCEMKWAMDREIQPKYRENPAKLVAVLDDNDIEMLVNNARSIRQRLFVQFLSATGMRISEVCAIRKKDIEPIHGGYRVRYIAGKTNLECIRELSADLINEIWNVFNGEEFLFETASGKPYQRSYVSNQIAKLGHDFLNKSISAHRFRNYWVFKRVQDGWSRYKIARMLGHKNVGSHLTHYDYEDAECLVPTTT